MRSHGSRSSPPTRPPQQRHGRGARFWNLIRDRRIGGFKFRRQHSCAGFVLDFYCAELKLAIELDGGQHYQREGLLYDERRTAKLRERGIVVLRFPTDLVIKETRSVLEQIARELGIADP